MRKEFSAWAERYGAAQKSFVFLTGDLGFQALENVQKALGPRFVNMGVAEQNMVSVAAGLAQQGLQALCYSIAPFAVFRPAEQIRLDVALHGKDVKIVGNGGGYGYGIMGATHHAIEDLAMLSAFQHLVCYVPFCNEGVAQAADQMMNRRGPAYLRLGFAAKPQWLSLPGAHAPVARLCEGEAVTLVGLGPVVVNALEAARAAGVSADVFAVSELPLRELGPELRDSLRRTGRCLIVEEHVRRGGLGEMLALLFLEAELKPRIAHLCAQGYPTRRYGSQKYHQGVCGLDAPGITAALRGILSG